MSRAEDLIALYDFELSKAMTFRTLYQNVADLMFPHENSITRVEHPGREKTEVVDQTGVMAAIEMTNGLSVNLFPPGQRFYNVVMSDRRLNEIESVKQALGQITEISHEKRVNSNFMLQANETLRSITVFGTGNLFSEWVPGIGLNYRDYDVGQYLIMENTKGLVDTMLIKFPKTARQATQEWGDRAGKSVTEAMVEPKNRNKIFWFLRVIRPRENRNPRFTDNLNMPFESIDVSFKDKVEIAVGGFDEFPHFVTRWSKSSTEIWGRGQGTVALPSVRELQVVKKDFTEAANKHNNPALEVLESFEGEVKVFAGAMNYVTELNSIKAIDRNALGNFPMTKDFLEMERDEIRKTMFNDIFIMLRDLKGDRRNELEIRARLTEGLERLSWPIGRIQQEWLSPQVTRDILLLLRNGQLPPLPPEMQGKSFKIEYLGRLALELNSQQAKGWQQWAATGAEFEATFPGITDNIDIDGGFRRLGETLGVSVEDMSSQDEVAVKRENRALKEQQALELQIAEMAGQAYQSATKTPEAGSPAEALVTG